MAEEESVGDLVVALRGDASELSELVESLNENAERLAEGFHRAEQGASALGRTAPAIKRLNEEAEGGHGAGGHGGGESHYRQMRAGGMALRMLGGGSLSHLPHMMHALGPIGGALIGFEMVKGTIEAMDKRQEELIKGAHKYSEELRKAADSWNSTITSQINTTELGKKFASEMLEAANKERSIRDEMIEREGKFRGFTSGGSERMGWAVEKTLGLFSSNPDAKTAFDTQRQLDSDKIAWAQAMAQVMETLSDKARTRQMVEVAHEQQYTTQKLELGRMGAGEGKKRAELFLEIEESHRKVVDKARDRLEDAKDAHTIEMGLNRQQIEAQNRLIQANPGVTPGDKSRLKEDIRRRNELHDEALQKEETFQKNRILLTNQGNREIHADERDANLKFDALSREHYEQRQKTEERKQEAIVQSQEYGYQREVDLLRLKNEKETKEFYSNRTGGQGPLLPQDQDEMNNISKIQQMELRRKGLDHIYEIEMELKDLRDQDLVTTHQMSAATAEWDKKEQELLRTKSMTEKEIRAEKEAFMQLKQDQLNQPIKDNIAEMNVELHRSLQLITDAEAAFEKMRIAQPDADQGLQRDAANLQEKVKMTQWAHDQLANIHPEMQIRDYARQIQAAFKSGAIDMREVIELMNKKAWDVFGKMDVGSGISGMRASQMDVWGMNMNTPSDGIHTTVKENGRILTSINDKFGQLIFQGGLN